MSCRAALVRGPRHRRQGIQDQAYSENSMKRTELHFVICIKNKNYAASLELRKLYQVVADAAAAELHQIRVIDESGKTICFPKNISCRCNCPSRHRRRCGGRSASGTR